VLLSETDLALSVALGVGLAAATGLRVFLPLLVMSVAASIGYLPLGEEFAWLSSPGAIAMLSVAALLEILAYYIPGVDNLLDAVAAPVAVVAGIVASAAVMTDLPPALKWTTAVIAGGGAAGLFHGATAAMRAGSTLGTGGLGNAVVATAEVFGGAAVALLAIAAPLLAIILVLALAILGFRLVGRWVGWRRGANLPPEPPAGAP